MDINDLEKKLGIEGLSVDDQMELLDALQKSTQSRLEIANQELIGKSTQVVIQGLKKIKSDLETRFSQLNATIESKASSLRDGKDGKDGKNGKDGLEGKQGLQGRNGQDGRDGRDGLDGTDGISVIDAKIDFDGSLIITLSDGNILNVGEVVSPDIAEKINVISTMSTNGAVAIKDEGTSITSGVKTINFVGATVTATNSGDDVTVNVSAGTGTVTSVAATAGTGISITGSPITTSGTLNITNTAPDQTVALTAGTGISTSGTYPNFTITNSAPDQTVALTGAGTTSVTGTYPNFTITSNDSATGTVTSVGLSGGTTGLTVTGSPITTSGTITLGGTLDVDNGGTGQTSYTDGQLLIGNTTGNTLTKATLTAGSGIAITNGGGSISIAATNNGTVTSVTGTSPVASSGGATPAISLASGYGDTLNPYASKTANYVLAAPNGTAGAPTFRAVVAADIPTLNQNTTGSAATLTTTRAIYGNNFDGSAALTQIIASTYGGTGNGFTKFTGATTAEKTYTLPDASSTIVVQGGALGTPSSGTVTNLTGTASININGTVGATTANTGAFTTLSATGVTTVQTGTAALPAITTTGDTNTGIFFPAADTIAFSEGGTEAMRIDNSGNMGIGTASPDSSNKLEVAGNIGLSWGANKFIGMKYFAGASYKMGLMLNDATRECKVWSQSSESDDKITFYTGSTPSERMRITAAGGVSFGSTGTAYGTSGQVLTSAGNASPTWTTAASGTVTSVAATVPSFLSVSGSPITTSGTLAITLSGTALPVVNGGTGVTTSTGSGNVVLSTSPSLTTPVLGTPTSGTLSNCTVDGTDAVGFRNVPVNSQSAAYTLVLADSGKTILHPSSDANARTFTIPSNASVAYAIGTVVTFINMTSQVVTIAINTDTMYLSSAGTTGSRSLAQYGSATALKITSTNWLISGSGLT